LAVSFFASLHEKVSFGFAAAAAKGGAQTYRNVWNIFYDRFVKRAKKALNFRPFSNCKLLKACAMMNV
jgi:hypothetical protein